MEEYSEIEEFELQLNESAKGFLKEAAKWAYFLSILGYVGIGFIVLAAIFAGALFAFIGNLSREMGNVSIIGRFVYFRFIFDNSRTLFLSNILFEQVCFQC